MRDLKRNQTKIYYALYQENKPILDDDGYETGEYESTYSNPVSFDIHVSASKGETEDNAFGKSLEYDKVISTHDMKFPIDEYSRLWIDVVPIFDVNGATSTKHDYEVEKVAKSLNSKLYAIKKVK